MSTPTPTDLLPSSSAPARNSSDSAEALAVLSLADSDHTGHPEGNEAANASALKAGAGDTDTPPLELTINTLKANAVKVLLSGTVDAAPTPPPTPVALRDPR